tara:strand:- start:8348 stop:8731 length:384 start_codon:yes stop_codon:yes gene_type:complete
MNRFIKDESFGDSLRREQFTPTLHDPVPELSPSPSSMNQPDELILRVCAVLAISTLPGRRDPGLGSNSIECRPGDTSLVNELRLRRALESMLRRCSEVNVSRRSQYEHINNFVDLNVRFIYLLTWKA